MIVQDLYNLTFPSWNYEKKYFGDKENLWEVKKVKRWEVARYDLWSIEKKLSKVFNEFKINFDTDTGRSY